MISVLFATAMPYTHKKSPAVAGLDW